MLKKLGTLIEDGGILLLIALLLPFVVLLVGMPIALAIRLVLEIVKWLGAA